MQHNHDKGFIEWHNHPRCAGNIVNLIQNDPRPQKLQLCLTEAGRMFITEDSSPRLQIQCLDLVPTDQGHLKHPFQHKSGMVVRKITCGSSVSIKVIGESEQGTAQPGPNPLKIEYL